MNSLSNFLRPDRGLLLVLLSTIVAACGGGGGNGSSTTTPPPTAAIAPAITSQPANLSVAAGSSARFSVSATGTSPLAYQWKRNGSVISGATSASYSLTAALADNGALFSVVITNSAGSATSSSAILTVTQPTGPAPAFTLQPKDATITDGQTATFSVTVVGTPTPTLSWQRSHDGVVWTPLAGATATACSVAATVSDDGTLFRAVATNSVGSATSETALLNVYPPTGNPDGHSQVPAAARAEDTSTPDHVVGTGTPESCTADAFIAAVAQGGRITFNGGKTPFTLVLNRPAKIVNDKPDVVIDGGGVVTLSGGGTSRILYMNTCDEQQVWTTDHCQNQDHPHLTVQNLTFIDGNSKNETAYDGGGAIWVRGGRFKIVNCRFLSCTCASEGPDVGGAAVRVFSQYQDQPVYVVNSTFGGSSTQGNYGSNGGGLSSIGVNWEIYNSVFSYNRAVGNGGNPAQSGTPGGGSGGAIYMDGNTLKLSLYGTLIEQNTVNAFGSAIFLVSNSHSGTLHVEDSIIRDNHGGSWYALPGISMFDDTVKEIINSVIQ